MNKVAAVASPLSSGCMSPEQYVLFREFVRARTGIVYGATRRSIFEARVESRVRALGLVDVDAYHRYLLHHPESDVEFLELVSVLTNNETFFMREQQTMRAALDHLGQLGRRRPRRLLSAGASSGEELASLAMLLKESGHDLADFEFQGVDIDTRMVRSASDGLYRSRSFRSIDADRVVRFFTPEGEARRLKPSIHQHLRFRWANLVDPGTLVFPHRFDLVFIRNVLIYFDGPTIEAVARTLHRLLHDDGALATGVSESLAQVPFLFDPVRAEGAVLYRKVPL